MQEVSGSIPLGSTIFLKPSIERLKGDRLLPFGLACALAGPSCSCKTSYAAGFPPSNIARWILRPPAPAYGDRFRSRLRDARLWFVSVSHGPLKPVLRFQCVSSHKPWPGVPDTLHTCQRHPGRDRRPLSFRACNSTASLHRSHRCNPGCAHNRARAGVRRAFQPCRHHRTHVLRQLCRDSTRQHARVHHRPICGRMARPAYLGLAVQRLQIHTRRQPARSFPIRCCMSRDLNGQCLQPSGVLSIRLP
jgi:hypothetical protein